MLTVNPGRGCSRKFEKHPARDVKQQSSCAPKRRSVFGQALDRDLEKN